MKAPLSLGLNKLKVSARQLYSIGAGAHRAASKELQDQSLPEGTWHHFTSSCCNDASPSCPFAKKWDKRALAWLQVRPLSIPSVALPAGTAGVAQGISQVSCSANSTHTLWATRSAHAGTAIKPEHLRSVGEITLKLKGNDLFCIWKMFRKQKAWTLFPWCTLISWFWIINYVVLIILHSVWQSCCA